jgi:hypothetical protein
LFEGITLHTLRTFFGRMNNWQREGKDGRQIW